MLKDETRTKAYSQAISQIVKPGDVVLDVGAGTGILSIFAAQAGAAHVYAVERTPISATARDIIEANGLSDRITVISEDIRDIALPEKVDVIVSEWMGFYGIDENFLQPLLVARDRFLKPNGSMIPNHVTMYMAPIWDIQLFKELKFWDNCPYGVDFSTVINRSVNEVIGQHSAPSMSFPEKSLRAHPCRLGEIDAHTFPEERAFEPFRASVVFDIDKDTRINAVAAWFAAELAPKVVLTNAPGSPSNHWGIARLPLTKAMNVKRGSQMFVEFSCTPAAPGYTYTEWAVRINSGLWDYHSDNPSASLL
jgi:predicted RNA methylase